MKRFAAKWDLVATAMAVALVIGLAGGMVARILAAGSITGAAPATAPAASRPASAPAAVDLSTPENTLASLSQAIKDGDRARTYACLAVDPARSPTLVDAVIAENLAECRMVKAARKAFGVAGENVRNGVNVDLVLDLVVALGFKAQVAGETAALRMAIPPAVAKLLDPAVAAWTDKPIRFIREGGRWKIAIDRTVRVEMSVNGPNLPPEASAKRNVDLEMAFAKSMDTIAQGIDLGLLTTLARVQGEKQTQIGQVMQKFGIGGFSVDVVAVEPPATLP